MVEQLRHPPSLFGGGPTRWLAAVMLLAGVLRPGSGREVVPRMMLLDGAVVGGDVIAVGERGTILRSTTQGRTWESAAALLTATLTGVSFSPDGRQGWVVGHDALILGSSDGGRSWAQQHQGNLQDSFLDVLALDARRAIAVGGYGLYLTTDDGGATWARRRILPEDYHFNRLSRGPSGTLYLAGEHGTLLKSANDGAEWTAIPAPYDGSFYGILPLDRQRLLAYGLRGHLYRSTDDGASWEQISTPHPVLLATGLKMRSNYIVLGGQARGLLVSRDYGRSVAPFPTFETGVAELLELPDGTVLVLGEAGAAIISVAPR